MLAQLRSGFVGGLAAVVLSLGCGSSNDSGSSSATSATGGVAGASSGSGGVAGSGGVSSAGGSTSDGAAQNSAGQSGAAGVGGGGGAAAGDTMVSACRKYLDAWCERSITCSANRTMAQCLASVYPMCPDLFFSPGTTRTIEGVASCSGDIRALSCTDWEAGKLPACSTPGTRVAGETCAFAGQCASFACSANGDACGTCLPMVGLGEFCDEQVTCASGQRCNGACEIIPDPPAEEPLLGQGAVCNANTCVVGLSCLAETPYDPLGVERSFTCRPVPESGEPCAFGMLDTLGRCAPGLYCSDTTCRPLPAVNESCALVGACASAYCDPADTLCKPGAALGEACGATASGAEVPCAPGDAVCSTVESGGGVGICQVLKQDGESCAEANTACLPGSSCDGGLCAASDTVSVFAELCTP